MYPGHLGHSQQQFDRTGQPNHLQSNVAGLQYNQAQMQAFNGYSSMPPPGATMQQGNPQYQAHLRNGSQQMPPASPGYAQSPNSYHTPTPPGQGGQPFYPPQAPTSQPMSGSPQAASNPLLQKQTMAAQGDLSKPEPSRIDLLLELNKILLQETMQLQNDGKGQPIRTGDTATGQQSPTASEADGDAGKTEDAGKKAATASREYMECMLRLRANFAYLTNLATPNSQKQVPRPQILEPLTPSDNVAAETQEAIKDLYKRLKELFQAQAAQPQQSPQQAPQMIPQQIQQQMGQQMPQQGMTAQQQAQNLQQQILQHQQQIAAQAAQAGNMHMNPQLLHQQQQMMARAIAMQNQQQNMGMGPQ